MQMSGQVNNIFLIRYRVEKAEANGVDTLAELIGLLQRKVSIDGIPATTRLQYIILDESGTLVSMKMQAEMAGRVIKVLKVMTRKR